MTQSVNDESVASWQQLQGNKYLKALHPAMLSDYGYRTTIKTRLVGGSKFNSQYLTVLYDRDYVVAWLASRLIKPLQNQGLECILEMVREAWKLLHQPRAFYGNQLTVSQEEDE